MYRIYLLLLLLSLGCSNQTGSLVLTSSPLTATEGELFTLICNSSYTGADSLREWHINGSVVFSTNQGQSSPTVASTWDFNRFLSGPVSVSCNNSQHNVTLYINSTVNNGSVWECLDNQHGPKSNSKTIYVTAHQTTVAATSSSEASVTTATATDITSTGSTETPTSPTSKHLNTTSTTTFTTTTNNNTNGKRISTSGSTTTTINNGKPTTTSGSTAGESAGQSNTIAIAAGAAGGGVVVIAVVIVAAICIRKRRRSLEEDVKDKNRRDRNPYRSAEMLIEGGVTEGDEKVMMDNIIYTSSSDVVPAEYSIHNHDQADKVMQDNILYTSSSDIEPASHSIEDQNHVGKDVYTQVKKVKTNADKQEATDVYAKPHKGRQETPNGDVYAKVNKVKSSEGTNENIEDMYAKPQKDKRNLRSKTDDE